MLKTFAILKTSLKTISILIFIFLCEFNLYHFFLIEVPCIYRTQSAHNAKFEKNGIVSLFLRGRDVTNCKKKKKKNTWMKNLSEFVGVKRLN